MGRLPRGSLAEALFWLVFAGAAFALTYQFDEPLYNYRFGVAGWPRGLIVGMALAALALLASSASSGGARGEDPLAPAGPPPHAPAWGGSDLRAAIDPPAARPGEADLRTKMRRITIFVLPLLYVFAMNRVGFLLITPFFLALYMYVLGLRRWWTLTWVTLGIYGLIVLIFVKLLFTPLPQGAGFFHSLNGQYVSLIR